jgi:hypothetical protein
MTALTILHKFWLEYAKHTSKKLKIIDAYLLYVFLTGVIQFVYCCLVGTFPFNSFLSGFISCVSCFILGGNSIALFVIYVHLNFTFRSWNQISLKWHMYFIFNTVYEKLYNLIFKDIQLKSVKLYIYFFFYLFAYPIINRMCQHVSSYSTLRVKCLSRQFLVSLCVS